MRWGDGQSEVTFPITSVMIGFFYQMTFFFIISINTVSLDCTPGSMQRYLAVSLVAGIWTFLAQSIFMCIEPGKHSAHSAVLCAPQKTQPSIHLLNSGISSLFLNGNCQHFLLRRCLTACTDLTDCVKLPVRQVRVE